MTMVFATLLFYASMLLSGSGMGPKMVLNAPAVVTTFPAPIALISEDADGLVAWRNASPIVDHPSLRMLLIAEKPFGEQGNLKLPFVNFTPISDFRSRIVGCLSEDGSSSCDVVELENTSNATAVYPILTGIVAYICFAFDVMATSMNMNCMCVVPHRFVDLLTAVFRSEWFEISAAAWPDWGLVPFLFDFLTCLFLPLLFVVIAYRRIVKDLGRVVVERPRAPDHVRVHFACVEGSATTSMVECPRLFTTLEEKALLWYSPQDFARFRLEYEAELYEAALQFRDNLKQVLMTKQKDQARRMSQWRQQVREEKERNSHRNATRGAQDNLGRMNAKRQRLR